MTTDELLAQCKSVHHILEEWFAYVDWRCDKEKRLTGRAVAKGSTPREAMERAIAASSVPWTPADKLREDASLQEVADKVTRRMSPQPSAAVVVEDNADLFG